MVELPLLIRADKDLIERGVLKDSTLDLAYGKDENDFVLTTPARTCEPGDLLYMQGTEYGGLVSSIKIDTVKESVQYTGCTWQGALANRVLAPDSGQDYLTVSGELNALIEQLLVRVGLSSLMVASAAATEVSTTYQFERYVNAYVGMTALLEEVGHRLQFVWQAGRVIVSAVPVVDYTDDETLYRKKYSTGMTIEQDWRKVNHLICLGKGELGEQQLIHLYADVTGAISTTQTIVGLGEVVCIYDYSSAKDVDELESKGRQELAELRATDSIKVDIDTIENYQVGDLVGAVDEISGIHIVRPITKKIVKVADGELTVSYEID
jgi:hypothetical protein